MELTRAAKAGSMESSDIFIIVEPNDDRGVEIDLESIVIKQFGEQIKAVMEKKVKEMGVSNIKVTAKDRGSLDYTIEARLEAAIKRGTEVIL